VSSEGRAVCILGCCIALKRFQNLSAALRSCIRLWITCCLAPLLSVARVAIMSQRLFIQAQIRDVKKIKTHLEGLHLLAKSIPFQKIGESSKVDLQDDLQWKGSYMLIPTTVLVHPASSSNHGQADPEIWQKKFQFNNLSIENISFRLIEVQETHETGHKATATSNSILSSVQKWIKDCPQEWPEDVERELIATAPTRWSVYEPMVLLPSGSCSSQVWQKTLHETDASIIRSLWTGILNTISTSSTGGTTKLTHLAINQGIPLHETNASSASPNHNSHENQENILRSPIAFQPIFGDFGTIISKPASEVNTEDFNAAFWVSTKQNGITQIWAPQYTMFSRGNVKEKARVLKFPAQSDLSQARENSKDAANEKKVKQLNIAVDLYAGIGYFVFSYAATAWCDLILGWEINPWSVEGLRRGAVANGWDIVVLRNTALNEDCVLEVGKTVEGLSQRKANKGKKKPKRTIVIFEESNEMAEMRIKELKSYLRDSNLGEEMTDFAIRHVNLGFLPTSQPSWRTAAEIVAGQSEGAVVHAHENVGESDISRRKEDVEMEWGDLMRSINEKMDKLTEWTAQVSHVEKVKTFAPGVWHVVFDIEIGSREQAKC
jgi:tRNA wybutosine-synthesizing protein 2